MKHETSGQHIYHNMQTELLLLGLNKAVFISIPQSYQEYVCSTDCPVYISMSTDQHFSYA